MDWYPRYPKKFDRGTLGWSYAERGAYSALVDAYYDEEGPLPDDDVQLAALTRASLDDWMAVAAKVRTKFIARGGKLHHEICDKELRKQADRAATSRENGKGGGRPKGSGTKDKKPDQNPAGSQQGTQTKPHNTTGQNKEDSSLRSESLALGLSGEPSSIEARMAYDLYNQFAGKLGLPAAQKLGPERVSKIRARLRDAGGLEGWRAALEKLAASSYCQGSNGRGWRADLDFLLQAQSFTRLMEGRYDDRKPTASSKTTGHDAFQQASLEILASLRGGEAAGGQWPDDVPGDGTVIQGRMVAAEDDTAGAGRAVAGPATRG